MRLCIIFSCLIRNKYFTLVSCIAQTKISNEFLQQKNNFFMLINIISVYKLVDILKTFFSHI